MKISHKEMQTKEVEIEDDILCNKCGLSCHRDNYNLGLIEYKLVCGYASIFGDGNIFRFSLCERCISKIFKTFAIPAQKTVCGWAASEKDLEEDIEPGTYEKGYF
jgi:hypothetical protein